MEFRYRAIDIDRPPPAMDCKGPSQSPNSNFSFFSAPSIPGASEVDVQEAIRRELEKEQILLQIKIDEASRNRDLIAEVLQDISMETRQVSDTGMSKLEEKLTLLINQMKHPNLNQNPDIDPKMYSGSYNSSLLNSAMMLFPQLQQMHEATGTSAMTSNNEKLIVLNRADTIGAKHDTMQLPQLQLMPKATETSPLWSNKEKLIVLARADDSVGAKRKAEDTETGMNKRQKAEEAVLEGETMSVKTGEIVSWVAPCLGELGSRKEIESKVRRSSYRFWCEICGVGAFSERVMSIHELSKNHKAAVTERNEAVETASSSLSPASVDAASQAQGIIIVCENGNQKGDEMSKKTESEKKGRLRCETCNVKTNSEELMRYHMLGKKHKKKQRLLSEEEGKIEVIVIEDDC